MTEPLPSALRLPPAGWQTLLDGLCAQFPRIERARWIDRFERGRILDAAGRALRADAPYVAGATVRYFREVDDEPVVPFEERLIHVDDDLVIADKPPFLPVSPVGPWVNETLHARLVRRLGNPTLVPLHRIDRLTSGLVLFSANPATRAAYQALFRERRIEKEYHALAAPLPHLHFPLERRTRLERGEPFFRMREVEGEPNAVTRIDVLDRGDGFWRYRLRPVTGRKHQLRVQLAALGAPIANDPLYPDLRSTADDVERPLALLAHALAFRDPVDAAERAFVSTRNVGAPTA